MKVKTFILFTGYVESGSFDCMLLQHKGDGFDSVAEGLTSFAEFFLECWKKDYYLPYKKDCCKEQTGEYCSVCGRRLNVPGIDAEVAETAFMDFIHSTADSLGTLWDYVTEKWSFGSDVDIADLPNAAMVFECAETILAQSALGVDKEYSNDLKYHCKVPDGMVLDTPKSVEEPK